MKKIFLNSILILGGIISSFNLISCDKKEETSVNESYKFYVLRQEKLVETMHHSISLYSGGDVIQLMQSFFIYDEELGALTKENMDVPSYSMAFNCNFYLFEDNELDKHEKEIKSISETELKVTKKGVFEITVTLANLEHSRLCHLLFRKKSNKIWSNIEICLYFELTLIYYITRSQSLLLSIS